MIPKHHLHRLLVRIFGLLSRCSLASLHRLGSVAGVLTYACSGTYRQRLKANMARGLGRAVSGREYLNAAAETGKMMLELPFVWARPAQDSLALVAEVRGWEHVEALRAANRPILALTPHLGCFEIVSAYIGARLPMTVLYRPPKQSEFEPILRSGRARGQITLAPADLSGVRRLIKAMRAGEISGLLPDQAPGNGEGLWSPFFGKPAYTMTLAARLSEVKDAGVLFFWGERLPAGRGWRIHVSPPSEALDGTLEERVHSINREVERTIRQCPSQYLWGYNRYKTPAGVAPASTDTPA